MTIDRMNISWVDIDGTKHMSDNAIIQSISTIAHDIEAKFKLHDSNYKHVVDMYHDALRKINKLERQLADIEIAKNQTNLSYAEALQMLEQYKSPDNVMSSYRHIPIGYVNAIKKHFRGKFRILYRGSSKKGYKRPQAYCNMRYADTFALYEPNRWRV